MAQSSVDLTRFRRQKSQDLFRNFADITLQRSNLNLYVISSNLRGFSGFTWARIERMSLENSPYQCTWSRPRHIRCCMCKSHYRVCSNNSRQDCILHCSMNKRLQLVKTNSYDCNAKQQVHLCIVGYYWRVAKSFYVDSSHSWWSNLLFVRITSRFHIVFLPWLIKCFIFSNNRSVKRDRFSLKALHNFRSGLGYGTLGCQVHQCGRVFSTPDTWHS